MRLPRVKRVHRPYRTDSGAIRIGGSAFGVAAEINDPDGVVWSLITAMDGTRTPEQVVAAVRREYPKYRDEDVHGAIDQLIATGYFEDAAATASLSPEDQQRYSRSMAYYSYVDRTPRRTAWEVQERIAAAHVAILGVGGVGSAAAYGLVASGVGALTLIDPDTVASSNLNRQLLYVAADIGRPKVTAAAERLTAIRPDAKVDARRLAIDSEAAVVDLFQEADLVVLCADTPVQIEEWSNRAALRTHTPWVNAAYDGPHVCVTRYVPGEGPCWRCMRLNHYDRDPEPGEHGHPVHMATAATANLAGTLATHVALAQITGVAPPSAGEPVVWNTVRLGHAFVVDGKRRPDCPECAGPDGGRGDDTPPTVDSE